METVAKLVLTQPDGHEQEFSLSTASATLGRAATNDIVLRDARVSRAHARLDVGDAGATLVDLGSANGTRVNGAPIATAVLTPGDVIAIGDCALRYEISAPRVEPQLTQINSESDLEATLAQQTLAATIHNTRTPRLTIHTPKGTRELALTQDAFTIGRDSKSDLVLDDPKSSRHHARLERIGDSFALRDLDSTNGTWLGEQRIQTHALRTGDTLRIGRTRLTFQNAFAPDDLTLADTPTPTSPRRPVVVVPGVMGSELWRGSECLWPNPRHLLTHPEVFRYPDDPNIEARGIVREIVIVPNVVKFEAYNRLGDYLEEGLGYERGKDLIECPYDWRQDIRLSARRLAEQIDAWNVKAPVTIIAHSMGCLVSREYIEHLGGKDKVSRLILMGGPHAGTPSAISNLLLRANLLPLGLMGERLRAILATFPSLYQILPTHAQRADAAKRQIDLFADEAWLPEPQRPLLRAAREFRRNLGTGSSVPTICIFGYGIKTITNISVLLGPLGLWQKVDFAVEARGDNTIPEASAVLPGAEIHPVQQLHGSLFVDNDVKMRLKLELTR
ncbi:MAG: FHA domain-containing protein [Chloroflexi bacterium]|nr:FHA domain-containing protein [Chloroflexota bacterium]